MARKTCCLSLTSIVLLTGAVWAGVDIPATCRIKNQPPGRCGWCSLETLGRYHQLRALYRLSEKNATRSSTEALLTTLDHLGIAYRFQPCGEFSKDILLYAVSQGLGATVGFRELHPGAGGHIVTLVEFTDEVVRVIDSNDQDGRIREMSPARFLYWWDGFALVLEPKEPVSEAELRLRFSYLPLVTYPASAVSKSRLIVRDENGYELLKARPSR
jgi:ABC-type bacteriocin/lantibiotic exporter with double-glycine peptidase domain